MSLLSRLRSRGGAPREITLGAVFVEGDGSSVEVVGESHYLDALNAITGRRGRERIRQPALAALVREPDNPYDADAVAIWIDGRKVGHLSRSDAQVYQEPLLVLARQNRVLACDALICGHEDTPNLGVWLELPAVDDVLLAIS